MATIQKKKKRKGKLSNAVVFLVAFVLFLAVFGGLSLWMFMKINQERQNSAGSSAPAAPESTVTFTAEDAHNLFLITTDGDAQGFLAIHADPANTRIRVLAIPRDTTVDVGTSQQRLHQLYASQGAQAAQDAAGKLLHIEFDNYAVITYTGVESWVKRLGGLTYNLQENLDYESEDGSYSVKLEGGARTLTAAQVVKVMRYPKWHGGRKQQADIQAELLSAMLNQYLVSSRNLEDDFNQLIELVQSDIKMPHFVAGRPALEYLAARNQGSVCSAVSLEGSYVGSGAEIRFEAAEDAASRLQTVFGNYL